MKFRKRIRIAPGIRLNLSLSGVSATIGLKGFNLNIGERGTYLNTGIPGTGLYDRQRISPNPTDSGIQPEFSPTDSLEADIEFKSKFIQEISSDQLSFIRKQIEESIQTKAEIKIDLNEAIRKYR